jgi:hypothetical protein
MTLAIPSKDTIVAMYQLYPHPSNLVFPPIFDYQLEHIFVMNRTLFAQVLTITPHLSLGGFLGMVYEHLLGCFILNDPSLKFLELFQVVVARGCIFKLMALVLGAIRLLAMAKDTIGFCHVIINEVFLQFISCSIVLQLWGSFQEHLCPH